MDAEHHLKSKDFVLLGILRHIDAEIEQGLHLMAKES
jgi:hypothetical protein